MRQEEGERTESGQKGKRMDIGQEKEKRMDWTDT